MKTVWISIKNWLAGAVAIGGCVGIRLGFAHGDDAERAMMIGCAALTLAGTLLGMIGASSLFWSPKRERKIVYLAEAGRKKAVAVLRKKETCRDTLTMFGWAFVFAGAGTLLLWYIFQG